MSGTIYVEHLTVSGLRMPVTGVEQEWGLTPPLCRSPHHEICHLCCEGVYWKADNA